MSKKNGETLIVDRVREQIQKIVDDEVEQLSNQIDINNGAVDRVKRKIEALLSNYRDTEALLGNLSTMSLLGLMGDSVKVQDIVFNEGGCNSVTIYSPDRDQAQVTVQVEGRDVFYQHPAGGKFVLNPKKKYRLLVAFIEKEEET